MLDPHEKIFVAPQDNYKLDPYERIIVALKEIIWLILVKESLTPYRVNYIVGIS